MPPLNDLEKALTNVYLKIFKEIKKEPYYPNNFYHVFQKYNKLVYDNTRSAIQQSVILGGEKVNRLFKTQPYITQADLDLIKKNSEANTASFWRKIQLDIMRKREQMQLTGGAEIQYDESGDPIPPPDLDMSAYLLSVAVASLFGSFADSTLSKTTELADTIPQKPMVQWSAVLDSKTCDQLPDFSEGCSQRNGKIYEIDDSDLLAHMPGTGTHPWCRCELIPII